MQILSIVDPAYHTYSSTILQFCRQMSKNVSYILQAICIWYGIRLKVNVVPQCRTTLHYVVSYVQFLEDFAQTKYSSSNDNKNNGAWLAVNYRRWYVFISVIIRQIGLIHVIILFILFSRCVKNNQHYVFNIVPQM